MRRLLRSDVFILALNVDAPVGRAEYVAAGAALMALKYAVDAILVYWWTGILWTPLDYPLPLASFPGTHAARFPGALSLTLLLWALPFVWIGVILSVRRAADAGLPPALVVAFFLPFVNYLLIATLAVWPAAPRRGVDSADDLENLQARHAARRSLAAGVTAGLTSGILLVVIGTLGLRTYGLGVFAAAPFATGVAGAYAARRMNPRSRPLAVVACTVAVLAGAVVLLALEGIVCLLMAAPLAIPVMALGGIVGHNLGARRSTAAGIALFVAFVPVGQAVDAAFATPPVREVLTVIEIDAPAERVWPHVVSFRDIDAPPAWYFRAGLAYPLRARIEGAGVGAVRYCEFTTGAFREPITVWNEPAVLAFDVADQPPPLREWSPWRSLRPPHLDGYFRTARGEFRLVRLAGGRTRLEGRTWYSVRMQPQGYWTAIADAILHRIHTRVLEHIRREAEAGVRAAAAL